MDDDVCTFVFECRERAVCFPTSEGELVSVRVDTSEELCASFGSKLVDSHKESEKLLLQPTGSLCLRTTSEVRKLELGEIEDDP